MTFFQFFFFSCTSTHQGATFLLLSKFHIFSRLEKSWGNKEYENFRLKWRRRPKKWLFFGFFFSFAHLHIEVQLFCVYQNFISSAVQRNHGGTRKKRYINDERTTNEQRRTTTNYMDDDNSPPGFFQNPRANNSGDNNSEYKYMFLLFISITTISIFKLKLAKKLIVC